MSANDFLKTTAALYYYNRPVVTNTVRFTLNNIINNYANIIKRVRRNGL